MVYDNKWPFWIKVTPRSGLLGEMELSDSWDPEGSVNKVSKKFITFISISQVVQFEIYSSYFVQVYIAMVPFQLGMFVQWLFVIYSYTSTQL